MIDKVLYDEEEADTLLTLWTDDIGHLHIQLKSDSGCEVFEPSVYQLLKLKSVIDDYVTFRFKKESSNDV